MGAGGDDHGSRCTVRVVADRDGVRETSRPSPRTRRPPLPVNRSAATWSFQSSVASSRIRSATGARSARIVLVPDQLGHAAALGERIRGPDHHLARDTAPVRALPTDELLLDADDVDARLGELAGDVLTARAHPDDDDFRGVFGHGSFLPNGVLATASIAHEPTGVFQALMATSCHGGSLAWETRGPNRG